MSLMGLFLMTAMASGPATGEGYNSFFLNSYCVATGCFHGHCNTDSDIEIVTNACQGIGGNNCVKLLCNQRGDCGDIDVFVRYANLCGGG